MTVAIGAGPDLDRRTDSDPAFAPHAPRRRPLVSLIAVLAVLFVAWVAIGLAINPALDWSAVGHYLFNVHVLQGIGITLGLAITAELLAAALGILIAVGRLSDSTVLTVICGAYVWFFRSVPLLVLILLFGNIALFVPNLMIGVPFTDLIAVSISTNSVLTAFGAAVFALALHDAAYNAEIVRAGILSVGAGQKEAAEALGLTGPQTFFRVVLPQAIRVIIPPASSQFITLLKSTSLVSVIAVGDLLHATSNISLINQRTIELLFVATIWYAVFTSLATVAQRALERRWAGDAPRSRAQKGGRS